MPGTEQFTIGAEVSCTDGVCGKLSRVVVDPVAREVTISSWNRATGTSFPAWFPSALPTLRRAGSS